MDVTQSVLPFPLRVCSCGICSKCTSSLFRVARGDCWLVAVAASIAYVDPAKLESIMVDKPVSRPSANGILRPVLRQRLLSRPQ